MKCFIFDLDGTLIDSLADLAEGVNRMLDDHGYPRQPLESFPLYIGDGVKALVEKALPAESLAHEDLEARVADYQRHYADTWNQQTKPYTGIMELLKALRSRGGKIGVLSNKPHAFTLLCCKHFFPDFKFDAVFGAREEVPRKPDPAGALEIASLFGVEPKDCAFVGDSGIDMQTAVNAGMLPIGVSWGFRSVAELRECGALVIVSQAGEIMLV
jgi:phosphoglycolate phosphatase